MSAPSYTYTLTNGNTADATQVMQNFNDILNGVSDASKDLSINALTVAGTATLNGAINLGNASADDITVTGSLASSLPIKTTNSYDIGSATLGLRKLYLGNAGGSTTVNLASAASIASARSYTIPDVAGAGIVQVSLGVKSVSSADYVILDNDGYNSVLVSTGASQRTITLPAVSTNSGRIITVKKTDSGAGTILIDTPSTETIDGAAQNVLNEQYSFVTLISDGTNWSVISCWDYLLSNIAIGSKVELAVSTTIYNLTSLSLTSGEWMIGSQVTCTGSDTLFNGWRTSIVTTSATNGTTGDNRTETASAPNSLFDSTLLIAPQRVILTSATTYYLTSSANFTLGGGDHIYIYGRLYAMRLR